MSENQTGFKSYEAATALAAYRRVKLTAAGTVGYAGADENFIGVTTHAAESGAQVNVRLANSPGTFMFTASAAISHGYYVTGAANGKIAATAGPGTTVSPFQADEAATADGDIIECVFNP